MEISDGGGGFGKRGEDDRGDDDGGNEEGDGGEANMTYRPYRGGETSQKPLRPFTV